MCGMNGVATSERHKRTSDRKEAFLNGLIANMFRGMDSTGVAVVKEIDATHNAVSYYKRALAAPDFLSTKGVSKLLNPFQDYHYVMGHCRASTRGATANENAHPFQSGHIILTHNGTVATNDLKAADEFVDSAQICSNMAAEGELQTLEKLDGGFSLVWHNGKDDSLNFARNKRKPLSFAFVKDENTMFYSSEYEALFFMMGRNNFEVDGKLLITKPFVWYKFFKEDLRKYTKTEFKEYTRPMPPRHQDHRGWNGAPNNATVHQPALTNTTKSTQTTSPCVNTTVDSTDTDTAAISSKEYQAQGVPLKESRIKAAAARLKHYGLDFNRLSMMRPVSWQEYKNQKERTGIMYGYRLLENTPFVMYNVPLTKWQKWTKMGKIAVRTVNVRYKDPRNNNLNTVVVIPDQAWENGTYPKEAPKSGGGDSDRPAEAVPSKESEPKKQELVPFSGRPIERLDKDEAVVTYLRGPGGSYIPKEKWLSYASRGCGSCTGVVSEDHHALVKWLGDDPICHECAGHEPTMASLGLATEILH